MNLTMGSLLDFIGLGLGFLFTILIFSYLLGDNPFFRLAIHIFIGVSAAYVALVTINNVLIPRLIIPLINGTQGERLLSLLLFIPSLFLFNQGHTASQSGELVCSNPGWNWGSSRGRWGNYWNVISPDPGNYQQRGSICVCYLNQPLGSGN